MTLMQDSPRWLRYHWDILEYNNRFIRTYAEDLFFLPPFPRF